MTVDGKEKALETTLAQIRKRYGEGAIMKLDGSSLNIEAIPTGCLARLSVNISSLNVKRGGV